MKIAKLVIYSVVLIIMFLQDFAIAQSSEKLTDNIEHHSIATKRVDHKKMESYRGRLSQDMAQVIVQRAKYYSLDPLLVLEVMRQESSFNPNACSKANARGLMQFIPSTARRFGITNPHDISQSIDAGCRYLVFLIRKFNGRLDLVLAGYNAGEGAVERYGNRVPPYEETQNYVRTIISNYKRALLVKEAFVAQNNLVLAQGNQGQSNQGQGQSKGQASSTINRSIYKTTPVVMKRPIKPLTKRQIQQRLAELDNISSFSSK